MKEPCDWVIATALSEEFDAAVAILTETEKILHWNFPASRGMVADRRVICIFSGKGGPDTAAALQYTMARCTATNFALVGVAGGFPDKNVVRGDVVIAQTIFSSDFGKLADGTFIRRPEYDIQCDVLLVRHAELVRVDRSRPWFSGIEVARPDLEPSSASRLHTGYVVSGEKVVDDADYSFFREVRRVLPEIHAVEMEGVGAGASIRLAHVDRVARFILIKGISDEVKMDASSRPADAAGSAQRGQWKVYAAGAAAALTRRLIEDVPHRRRRGVGAAGGTAARNVARADLPLSLKTLRDARQLWAFVDGTVHAAAPAQGRTPFEPSKFVRNEDAGDKAERSIVSGLMVLAAHAGNLGASAGTLLASSIGWILDDRHSWNVGARALILAASIAAVHGPAYRWHDDSNVSACLSGRRDVLGRASRIATLAMLHADDDAAERLAGLVATAFARLDPAELEHPMLITCETLRACLVAAAETAPAAIAGMIFRIRAVLAMIDLSFYDKIGHGDKVHVLRLLIMYAHLVQCRKIIATCGADGQCIEKLQDVEVRIVKNIRHNLPISKAASLIARAAQTNPTPWQIEAACLHLGRDWSNGKIRGALREALIQYFDVMVNERTRHAGAGWHSWVQIMQVFGRNCDDAEIRRIAADAARKRESF